MARIIGRTEFTGENFVIIPNSDSLDLDKWSIVVKFQLGKLDNGCFIFDKRNGQWHRNYCFGYITPEWFKHHPTDMTVGCYFFVDVGDGSQVQDEFTNGVGVTVPFVNPRVSYEACMKYDGKVLSLSVDYTGVVEFNSRELNLGSVKGNGNLVIGSMGEPHLEAFPQYGLGRFTGVIESLDISEL